MKGITLRSSFTRTSRTKLCGAEMCCILNGLHALLLGYQMTIWCWSETFLQDNIASPCGLLTDTELVSPRVGKRPHRLTPTRYRKIFTVAPSRVHTAPSPTTCCLPSLLRLPGAMRRLLFLPIKRWQAAVAEANADEPQNLMLMAGLSPAPGKEGFHRLREGAAGRRRGTPPVSTLGKDAGKSWEKLSAFFG